MLAGRAMPGPRAAGRSSSSSSSSSGGGEAGRPSAPRGVCGGAEAARRRRRGAAAAAPRLLPCAGRGRPAPLAASSSSSTNSTTTQPQPPEEGALFAPDARSAAAARQQLFNTISPVYDELNDRLSFGMHRVWKRMAVRWALRGDGTGPPASSSSGGGRAGSAASASPPRRALDVCCGSGDLALLLADALEAEWRGRPTSSGKGASSPPLEVVGLDFAADMLADAARRERAQRRRPLVAEAASPSSSSSSRPAPPRVRLQWVQGDATRLPFPDASFGAATVGYGLRNVADRPAALRELARVLAPGSHLAVLDFANARGSGDWLADAAQGFFLERIVVPEAERFGLRDEYAYLRPSVHAYPPAAQLEAMALAAGFSRARFYPLALGMMGCLVATR